MTSQLLTRPDRFRQRGAAAVEFALVAMFFFMLLLGIIEMGRVLFTWNRAAETTRLGARVAVVCDQNDPAILANMQGMMPDLAAGQVEIDYQPAGCDVNTCNTVTVSVDNYSITPMIPLLPMTLPIPSFATSLTRESMKSTIDGYSNPVCSTGS